MTKDCVDPSKTHLYDYFLQLGHFSSETAQQETKHSRYKLVGDTTYSHCGRISSPDHIWGRQIFFFPIGGFPPLPSFAFALQKLFIACDILWGSVCWGQGVHVPVCVVAWKPEEDTRSFSALFASDNVSLTSSLGTPVILLSSPNTTMGLQHTGRHIQWVQRSEFRSSSTATQCSYAQSRLYHPAILIFYICLFIYCFG